VIELRATGRDVAMICRCEGLLVIERMQFLKPQEARAKAKAAARYQQQRRVFSPATGAGEAAGRPANPPPNHSEESA